MANNFSNSQNPKPTSEDNKPRKQQNQATIANENIKPKCAPVPRSINPSLGSGSGTKIMIFGFGFLLWSDESVGEVQGEKEEQGEQRKKGENEETNLSV